MFKLFNVPATLIEKELLTALTMFVLLKNTNSSLGYSTTAHSDF